MNQKKFPPKAPANYDDINKEIKTFLHLDRGKQYQLLHNDVIKGPSICEFQVYGAFEGTRSSTSGEDVFILERFAIKYVNLYNKAKYKFKISEAEFKRVNGKVHLDLKRSVVTKPEDKEDLIKEQLFLFSKFEDIEVDIETLGPNGATTNGIPCNQLAFFGKDA